MKSHNILIEPWREMSNLTHERGERLFRWTVTYRYEQGRQAEGAQGGVRFGQGTARTHAEARQAAEDFLAERGVELHWQPSASSTTRILTPRSGKPRFLQL
ncbi:hypothetical protein AAFN88_01945 [Pelagibius sp. CAU 1746]|uniref:hypothetical protein n=1 Tax=Pelagibius sp. CAU 1746 TaxID=3140370 RepID=UPI00325A6799